MVGLGDEVGAGKVAEVDLHGIVAHVQDLGDLFSGDGSVQAKEQEEDDGSFFDSAQEHDFVGGEDGGGRHDGLE